jgi:hypothetical protein
MDRQKAPSHFGLTNVRFRRQGVIGRAASEGPLFGRERPFVVAVLAGRSCPHCETGPGPQLVTWGKATILSVDAHGFKFDYTLNSAKHIPFDWEGP